MTAADKVIKTKVGVLELGKQLGNMSKAGRIMGYSRDSFYRLKELNEIKFNNPQTFLCRLYGLLPARHAQGAITAASRWTDASGGAR